MTDLQAHLLGPLDAPGHGLSTETLAAYPDWDWLHECDHHGDDWFSEALLHEPHELAPERKEAPPPRMPP